MLKDNSAPRFTDEDLLATAGETVADAVSLHLVASLGDTVLTSEHPVVSVTINEKCFTELDKDIERSKNLDSNIQFTWEHMRALAVNAMRVRSSSHWVFPVRKQIQAAKWEWSGLREVSYSMYQPDGLQIDAYSLAESIESGRIRSVIESKSGVRVISAVLAMNGIDVKPRELSDNESVRQQIELAQRIGEVQRPLDVLDAAMADARLVSPNLIKNVKGKHAPSFEKIVRDIEEELKDVQSGLHPSALHGILYREKDVQNQIDGLGGWKGLKINELAGKKIDLLEANAVNVIPLAGTDMIESHVLDKPRYLTQEDGKQCSNAVFRMVYEGVTGVALSEADVQRLVEKHFGQELIMDMGYGAVFSSEYVRSEYGVLATVVHFMGMDLKTIGAIAKKAKEKNPERKVHVVLNMRSEVDGGKRVQHRNVLLSAGYDDVYVYDPKKPRGPMGRKLSREEFYQRWAATSNSGYLVISELVT